MTENMKEILYVAHMNVRGNPYTCIEPFKNESTIFCIFNILISFRSWFERLSFRKHVLRYYAQSLSKVKTRVRDPLISMSSL